MQSGGNTLSRSLTALVFPGFETLDLFGPLEMFGSLPGEFSIRTVSERPGPVTSCHGQTIVADAGFQNILESDLILVPGGPGTPLENPCAATNSWLRRMARNDALMMGVCTGSALLACAGLLAGRRATTNKMCFDWATSFGPDVDWIAQARWVEDGNIITSSGVSAGMDMSLAVIARLLGNPAAVQVAGITEYDWHDDPSWDPFAEHYGLI